jgi:hypothetical protein
LRVGVVSSVPHPTEGGASPLLETLFQELEVTQSQHVFIPLRLTEVRNPKRLRTKVRATSFGDMVARGLRLVRPPLDPQMDSWVREQHIDIVWFLRQGGGRVSVPYITTVWDLAHRSQPYFPEVSITGWNWEEREQTYRSILPRASFILTGTNAGKHEIVHYYGVNPENVIVVPLPVPAFAREDHRLGAFNIREKHGICGDFLIYPAQFGPTRIMSTS